MDREDWTDVVELHVQAHNDREEVMEALKHFCEKHHLTVVRLFWRGVETDDLQEVE